ncbi:EFG12 [Auxenochlorella protothecoides x Auxenochlorella symbiontica]
MSMLLAGNPIASGRCSVPLRTAPSPVLGHTRATFTPFVCTSAPRTLRTRKHRARHAFVTKASASVAEAPPPSSAPSAELGPREGIRNIAIIAHVDHGKTTLVDAMLKQAKVFRTNQAVEIRIMDSNDLERERGITILSKNTAVRYKGVKINIIDTPGHADFGGEVERVLNMADGVLLLVDAVEGPMPQTRFVLKKALALNKKVLVVVNKVDRPAARPDWVVEATFDLFVDLGANDEQCDFPVVFASGMGGVAGTDPNALAEDLGPLFECILNEVDPPQVVQQGPLQLLVTNLDYDEHKGRIAIGRVQSGAISKGAPVVFLKPGSPPTSAKVTELFVYDNFARTPVDTVEAGDICAFTGLSAVSIGDTVCQPDALVPLPTIEVEEPTVRMTFSVNASPFAGHEGKFVTSRNLKDRLERELERNLALRVEPGTGAESFEVSGRGALHLGILMENMRREGFEFAVGPPKVITRTDPATGARLEPVEEAIVEVAADHVGGVVDLMAGRRAVMLGMAAGSAGTTRITYRLPTRGLLGLRSAMLTATKGTAVLSTILSGYEPWAGDISTRENGSLTAHETGQVTAYAVESVQQRGRLFARPGDAVYEDQVVGIHQRAGDLKVNVCRKKALTNMRASGKDNTAVLTETIPVTLDYALEYVGEDELVEVTPKNIRIRKNPNIKPKKK